MSGQNSKRKQKKRKGKERKERKESKTKGDGRICMDCAQVRRTSCEAKRWQCILDRAGTLAASDWVCIVVSAVTKVTDMLSVCVEEALSGGGGEAGDDPGDSAQSAFSKLGDVHHALMAALKLPKDESSGKVERLLADLRRLLRGISMTKEASPRLRARVSAFGELLSSTIGWMYLRANGLDTCFLGEMSDSGTVSAGSRQVPQCQRGSLPGQACFCQRGARFDCRNGHQGCCGPTHRHHSGLCRADT